MKNYGVPEITNEEYDAIAAYTNNSHLRINSLLEQGLENETRINEKFEYLIFDHESDLRLHLNRIQSIYSAMVKYSHTHPVSKMSLYRGTDEREVKELKADSQINRFISTTTDKKLAEGEFCVNWSEKAVVYINTNGNIPYLYIQNMKGYDKKLNHENEVLLSPFCTVDKAKFLSNWMDKNYYSLDIRRSDLPEVGKENIETIERDIIGTFKEANQDLQKYFELKREVESLEIIHQHDTGRINSEYGKGSNEASEARAILNSKRNEIEQKKLEMENCKASYCEWKDKVILYTQGKCSEIESNINREIAKVTEGQFKEINVHRDTIKSLNNEIAGKLEGVSKELQDIDKTQKKCAKISEAAGVEYVPVFNIEQTMKMLNEVRNYIDSSNRDIGEIAASNGINENQGTITQLSSILDTNKELCNCLPNTINPDLKEIKNNEFKSLKQGIQKKLIEIKASADKKIIDHKIEEITSKKSLLKKPLDWITGQYEVDSAKLEHLEIRRKAIDQTLGKVDNLQGKGIHQMVNDINAYVAENGANALIGPEIKQLEQLNEMMNKFFVIDNRRIYVCDPPTSEFFRNDGNTPLKNLLADKDHQIRIDKSITENWIKQNGYDAGVTKQKSIFSDSNKMQINLMLNEALRCIKNRGRDVSQEKNKSSFEKA